MGKITPPAPISDGLLIEDFDCGVRSLNDWLKKQAMKNEISGASRTYVVCSKQQVVGYYALASGSVFRQDAPGKIRRRMPDPIPVIVLGRLAVDVGLQKQGIGPGLLKDAILRAFSVSEQIGVRALLVHALSDDAKDFYLQYGFQESPIDPMTLMLALPSNIQA